jgi:hypothetical protein
MTYATLPGDRLRKQMILSPGLALARILGLHIVNEHQPPNGRGAEPSS